MGNMTDLPDVISLFGWDFGDNGAEVFASIIHPASGVWDGVGTAEVTHGVPFRGFTQDNGPSRGLEGGYRSWS
jgi:hypothetical protein